MELFEKAAYLQGLLEGLELDESTKEGKVFHAMSDLLVEMAGAIKTMEQDITQAEDHLDLLRSDVEELQADVYEDEDEDEEDDSEAPCYEVECPNCGDPIIIDDEALAAGEVQCPNCDTRFALDLTDDDGEDEEQDED